jgi:hypothetical protein
LIGDIASFGWIITATSAGDIIVIGGTIHSTADTVQGTGILIGDIGRLSPVGYVPRITTAIGGETKSHVHVRSPVRHVSIATVGVNDEIAMGTRLDPVATAPVYKRAFEILLGIRSTAIVQEMVSVDSIVTLRQRSAFPRRA